MGASKISDEDLNGLGIEIIEKTESGSYKLNIPSDSIAKYQKLIQQKLDPGFWNEYIGPEKIVFIFKFKDGEVQKFIYSDKKEAEIAKLCTEFSGDPIEKTSNLLAYLAANDFYHKILTDNYKLSYGKEHPESEFRKTIVAVVFNQTKDKILALDWEMYESPGLIVGGVEKGENYEETVSREIQEETGYINFELVSNLGKPLDAYFFANNKNKWRHAEMHGFLVVLKDRQQNTRLLTHEENSQFKLHWYDPDELIKIIDEVPVEQSHDFRPFSDFIKRALHIL